VLARPKHSTASRHPGTAAWAGRLVGKAKNFAYVERAQPPCTFAASRAKGQGGRRSDAFGAHLSTERR
jgi:hypothetical protein